MNNQQEGYKQLNSYILVTVIYDLTQEFLRRWINPRSRNWDQMDQAARSGKQNIAEGYTQQSLEGYIKLLGVAEGSLKELLTDFEDYLRTNKLKTLNKDDPKIREFRAFRAIWVSSNQPNTPNLPKLPQEAANMLLTFCQMATYLINRQIASLKEKFIQEGGFRENLFSKRRDYVSFKKRQEFKRSEV